MRYWFSYTYFLSIITIGAITVSSSFAQTPKLPSFSTVRNYGDKDLSYQSSDARIAFDDNLGQVVYPIKLPLPFTLNPLRKEIVLRYRSQLTHNLGYGHGFQLGLPQIFQVTNNPRTQWLYHSGEGRPVELEKVNGQFKELEKRHFLQFKTELIEGKNLTAAMLPNGDTKYFNQHGLLVKEENYNKKSFVDYNWNSQHQLTQIVLWNKRSMNLSYKDCRGTNNRTLKNQDLPIFFRGRWVQSFSCLDTITYSPSGRTLKFEYNDSNNLVKVFWQGSENFPIFHAQYSDKANADKSSLIETKVTPDFEIKGSPKKNSAFFKKEKGKAEFVDEAQAYEYLGMKKNVVLPAISAGGRRGYAYFADLNLDGVTDAISISRKYVPGQPDDDDSHEEFKDWVSPPGWEDPRVEVHLGTYYPREDRIYFSSSEHGFSLPPNFQVLEAADNAEEVKKIYNRDSREWRTYLKFSGAFILGDFDGNNFVDVLLCKGRSSTIAFNNSKGFDIAAEGDERVKNLNCPVESLGHDINSDGITDIISKDKVLLGSSKGFINARAIHPTIAGIQKRLQVEESDEEQEEYVIFDENRDGLPEIIHVDQYMYKTDVDEDFTIEYWKIDEGTSQYTQKKEMPGSPLLSRVFTRERGEMDIQYKIQNGKAVSDIITFNPLHEEGVVKWQMKYHQAFKDPFHKSFLGFHIVERLKLPGNGHTGSRTVVKYYTDNNPVESALRARIHGVEMMVVKCEFNKCQNTAEQMLNQNLSGDVPTDEHDYAEVSNWAVVSGLEGLDGYFVYPTDKTKMQIATNHEGNRVTRDFSTVTRVYSNFSPYGPLEKEKKTVHNGLKTLLGDQILGGSFEKEFELKQIFDGRVYPKAYLKIGERNPDEDRGELIDGIPWTISQGKILSQKLVEVSGDRNRRYTITKKGPQSRDRNSTARTYDEYGRLVKTDDLFRNIDTYIDFEETKLESIKLVRSPGKYNKLHFDSHGLMLKSKEGYYDALELEYDYSSDGIIKSLKTPRAQYNITRGFDEGGLVWEVTSSKDEKKTGYSISRFDGMGAPRDHVLQQDGRTYLSKKSLSRADGLVIKEFADKSMEGEHNSDDFESLLVLDIHYDHLDREIRKFNPIFEREDRFEYKKDQVLHYINDIFYAARGDDSVAGFPYIEAADGRKVYGSLQVDNVVLDIGPVDFNRDHSQKTFSVRLRERHLLYNHEDRGQELLQWQDIQETKIEDGRATEVKISDKPYANFGYDSRSRLNEASYPNSSLVINAKYDARSNIVVRKTIKGSFSFAEIQNFDSLNRLKSVHWLSEDEKNEYRDIGAKLYHQGPYLKSIDPFIDNIELDSFGHIKEVSYSGGAKVQFKMDAFGFLEEVRAGDHYEKYQRDGRILIVSSEGNLTPSSEKKTKTYEYSDTHKLLKEPRLETQRIRFGRLKSDDFSYLENSPALTELEGKKVEISNISQILGVGEESYPLKNLHFIDGHWVRYLSVQNRYVGAYIVGPKVHGFYPLVTDARNSIRAILNKEGEVLAIRDYTEWGEVSKQVKSAEGRRVDRFIRYDFAGLIRPYNSKYLISETRVYSPAHGQWLSFDNAVIHSPEKFIHGRIFEGLGFKYTAGDPINFIDPTGYAAGDVWLYRGSDTSASNLAEGAQSLIGKDSYSGHNYSHASIEVDGSNHFTSEGNDGAQIQSFKKALNNYSGQVDIYRHKNASSFNSSKATEFATRKSSRTLNFYGLNGICSTVARDAALAGGLELESGRLITSPNDLSNSKNLNRVGTYDNVLRMSYE